MFTSDARPVFPEERLLIEILIGKPLCYINDSVWNGAGNIYYVNGERIPLKISEIINCDANDVRRQLEIYKEKNSYKFFNRMIANWVAANSIRYNYISTEAIQFVLEKSKSFVNADSSATFVSFSGGKDSTVVSDLVRRSLGTVRSSK